MILESVEHGPLIWPTIEENGVNRTKKYAELSTTDKIQADCNLKATNIILQGLPSDIYSLVNHHRVSKDQWERIQLLMQGTLLTKQEKECKLYDVFDKFAHIKGESLHQYYLRFTQLINDINIYKMKLEQFQVITKFLNSLPPEWSKFVTGVKLVKDLHTSNFDQLHAYLQQHELHANESALCMNAIKIHLHGKVTWQDSVQNQRGKEMLHEGSITQTVITNNASYQANDLDAYDSDCDDITTAKVALMANLSRYGLDVLSEIPHSYNTNNDMLNQIVRDINSSEQQDAMILSVFEQLSQQVTNCNKINKDNLIANEFLSFEHKRYKERVKFLKERQNVDLGTREKLIIDDIIQDKDAQFVDFEKKINSLKQTLSEQLKEKESLTKTFNVLKNESKKKEAKNIDNEIALERKVKELNNIVYKMGQSVQIMHMLTKPQVFYDNNVKQARGFQNPFYLKKA
nr:hypothetical protein [Tanacetum cinerariifolium]